MFQVKTMGVDDFPFATQLANTLNWNMAIEDFNFITSLEPKGCFVLFEGSERLGIATTISFGKVGWFGNLIVKEKYRNKGGGSLLVKGALNYLHSKKVETIGLYAYTGLIDFYKNFDFKLDENFSVLHGKPLVGKPEKLQAKASKQDIPEIIEFDSKYFGASREKLLKPILREKDNLCYFSPENNKIAGYVAAKVYSEMAEVGPLICQANRTDAAVSLLETVLAKLNSVEVSMCMPKKENYLISMLFKMGFEEDFKVSRMFLGPTIAKDCIYMAESLGRG